MFTTLQELTHLPYLWELQQLELFVLEAVVLALLPWEVATLIIHMEKWVPEAAAAH
jgi:hypothetical protein